MTESFAAYVGTSGYSYPFWKGTFYPESVRPADMLRYYAACLRTVEINNTFYRMPKADVVENWARSVPPEFRFVIKASRRITHVKRLKDPAENLDYMFNQLEPLRPKLGPVLFQCPPTLKKDVERLREFLACVPHDIKTVLEFRHDSWFDDEVYATLHAAKAALCVTDEGDDSSPPLVQTAAFGYVRLRAGDYTPVELQAWAQRIRERYREVYVFFKHEETAPELAQRMNEAFGLDLGR